MFMSGMQSAVGMGCSPPPPRADSKGVGAAGTVDTVSWGGGQLQGGGVQG